MKKILAYTFSLAALISLQAQDYASWNSDSLVLNNGAVKRVVKFSNGSISTANYAEIKRGFNYAVMGYDEFDFLVNDVHVNGKTGWKVVSIEKATDTKKGNGAKIWIEGTGTKNEGLKLGITFLLYPDLPVVRKKISFQNLRGEDIKIESLNVENLSTFDWVEWSPENTWIMTQGGRHRRYDSYEGNWDDGVVVAHNIEGNFGLLLGNEASGVMKRTTCMADDITMTIGLSKPTSPYPFRKWLKKNDVWESPYAFTIPYSGTPDTYEVLNGPLNDFVRKHMGIKLAENKKLPVFIYNSWQPYLDNINEKFILNQIDLAAACGTENFTIDCGWFTTPNSTEKDNYENKSGDYIVDKKKFPRGIKFVTDYIRSKGMQVGLWFSIASAGLSSDVYKQHPDWFLAGPDGNHYFVPGVWAAKAATASLGSPWYKYIKNTMTSYIKELNIEYVKLDLGVVNGAYNPYPAKSGDYNPRDEYRDRPESMNVLHEKMWSLFDDLHKTFPNLFIDCTYEAMGKRNFIDLSMCKYAEGNWVSNFNERTVEGPLRMRNLAYNRTPAIPASSMLIGNLRLDDAEWELSLKSLIGTMPLMLGDISKMKKADIAKVKVWTTWLRTMQNKYNYLLYRQDLPGFFEPTEGSWDGYQRINTDTKAGGIIGVFKHGSPESQRTITVKYLNPLKTYKVKQAPTGRLIAELTGKDLAEKGFKVNFTKKYEGAVYEISEK